MPASLAGASTPRRGPWGSGGLDGGLAAGVGEVKGRLAVRWSSPLCRRQSALGRAVPSRPGHLASGSPRPARDARLNCTSAAPRPGPASPAPSFPPLPLSGGRLWTRSFNPSAPWPTPCGTLYLSPRVALAKDHKQGCLKHHGHLSSWSVSPRPNLPLLTRTPGTGLGAYLP